MIKRHTISFKNAFKGLYWALTTQPNYRIHLILSLAAVAGGWRLHISYSEWLVIISLIFIGFGFETINTAIEATTDAIDDKWRDDIKIAKDVAAGAMLIFAFGALTVAGIIFLPKLFTLFV